MEELAVHCDLPRLAPVMTVGGVDRSSETCDEGDDVWAERAAKIHHILIQVGQLTGDDATVLALTQKWDKLVPTPAVDMAPMMQVGDRGRRGWGAGAQRENEMIGKRCSGSVVNGLTKLRFG